MKTLLLHIFFILLSTSLYSQDLLEQAYKNKSEKELNHFFRNWQENIPPITNEEFKNETDTIQEAYKIFTAFYHPHHLVTTDKKSKQDISIYHKVNYYIVQNSLKISFQDKIYYSEEEIGQIITNYINTVDDPLKELGEFTDEQLQHMHVSINVLDQYRENQLKRYKEEKGVYIKLLEERGVLDKMLNSPIHSSRIVNNFRPYIKTDKPVVFLTPKYNQILNSFLGVSPGRIHEESNSEKPLQIRKDSEKRRKFLEKSIRISHGYWSNNWELVTYPEIVHLVFDKDMQYAKVIFRLVYQSGEAILIKVNDEWVVSSTKLIWKEMNIY